MKKAVLYDLQKKERTIESQITELKSQIKGKAKQNLTRRHLMLTPSRFRGFPGKESEERLVALHTAAEGLGSPERSAPRDVRAQQHG